MAGGVSDYGQAEIYRSLVENSLQGFVIVQDMRIVFANEAFADITGYTVGELLSLPPLRVTELIHPDDRTQVWGRLKSRLQGEAIPSRYTYRGLRKDGSVCWLEMIATLVNCDGKPAIQGAVADITDRVIAENTLKASEARYSTLVESTADGVVILQDGVIRFVNSALQSLVGYAPAELVGKRFLDLVASGDHDLVLRRHADRLAGQDVQPIYEISLVHADGTDVPVELNATIIEHEAKPAVLVSLRDVTPRIETENALRKATEWSETILHTMSEGVVEQDGDGNFTFVNPAAESMFGYSRGELLGKHWIVLIPPDQRSIVEEADERRARGESDRYELDVLRRDGSRLTAIVSGTPRWTDGKSSGSIVVFVDMTHQKEAARALTQSEARYRAVSELTSDFSYAYTVHEDGSLGIEWVTKALERLTGFTVEELTERGGWPALMHPDDMPIAEAQLERLLTGQASVVEYRILTKDDRTLWVRDSARSEWREETRRTTRIEGAVQNITEQRTAQETLQGMLEGVIRAVGMTAEVRDPYTAGHQQRVAQLAVAIAIKRNLSAKQVEDTRLAGLLHDIGKICVPAELLAKPTALTESEFGLIRRHPEVSRDILGSIEFANGIAKTAYQHHERLDGSGYPEGLSGDDIGIAARILAVADVVEAMSSHRPYRAALGEKAALEEINQYRGILYDPELVDACVTLFEREGFQFDEPRQTAAAL